MAKIWVGPTGKTVTGSLLDVSVTGFSLALKELDRRLYVKWNPEKLSGHGCWEVRIKPSKKTALFQGEYQGASFFELDYLETDVVHHILDCAFLNYDAIRKLKEMDTTKTNHFIHTLEYEEQRRTNEQMEKAMAERDYAMKQHRSAIKDLYERAKSGEDLHRIIGEASWTMGTDTQNT